MSLVNNWGNIITVTKNYGPIIWIWSDDDWFVERRLDIGNSFQRGFQLEIHDLQITMICTFKLYQKRKHLKYMAVETEI